MTFLSLCSPPILPLALVHCASFERHFWLFKTFSTYIFKDFSGALRYQDSFIHVLSESVYPFSIKDTGSYREAVKICRRISIQAYMVFWWDRHTEVKSGELVYGIKGSQHSDPRRQKPVQHLLMEHRTEANAFLEKFSNEDDEEMQTPGTVKQQYVWLRQTSDIEISARIASMKGGKAFPASQAQKSQRPTLVY